MNSYLNHIMRVRGEGFEPSTFGYPPNLVFSFAPLGPTLSQVELPPLLKKINAF